MQMQFIQFNPTPTIVLDILPEVNPDSGNGTIVHLVKNSYQRIIPPRRRTLLTTGDQYKDVTESFSIHILGDTDNACWETYQQIINLFDSADRFQRNDGGIPLVFRIKPNATSVYTDTLVLGSVDGETPIVGTSPTLIDDDDTGWVLDVPLTFRSKPLHLRDTMISTPLSASQNIETIFSVSFNGTDADVLAPVCSPTNVFLKAGPGYTLPSGLVLVGAVNKLIKTPAYLLTPSTTLTNGWQRQTESASRFALSNTVLVGAPPDLARYLAVSYSPDIATLSSKKVAFWITAKSSMPIYVTVVGLVGGTMIYGRPTLVNTTTPTIIPLGILTANWNFEQYSLLVQSPNAGATVTINALYALAMDDLESIAIPYFNNPRANVLCTNYESLGLYHNYLSLPLPYCMIRKDTVSASAYIPTDIAPLVLTKSRTLSFAWIGCSGNSWTQTTDGAATARTATAQATRYNGSIIPY